MKNCPGRHGLLRGTIPRERFTCDGCGHRFQVGERAFSCRACNYDLCTSCCPPVKGTAPVAPQTPKVHLATSRPTLLAVPAFASLNGAET